MYAGRASRELLSSTGALRSAWKLTSRPVADAARRGPTGATGRRCRSRRTGAGSGAGAGAGAGFGLVFETGPLEKMRTYSAAAFGNVPPSSRNLLQLLSSCSK